MPFSSYMCPLHSGNSQFEGRKGHRHNLLLKLSAVLCCELLWILSEKMYIMYQFAEGPELYTGLPRIYCQIALSRPVFINTMTSCMVDVEGEGGTWRTCKVGLAHSQLPLTQGSSQGFDG